jgi:FMN phosphatase YigB (HAD superfamily)
MKQTVSVLITDLDNTLYDWLAAWHASFRAMLDQLLVDTGLPEETLLREFKQVHEKYGTSEYSFSIEELPSLQEKCPGVDLAKQFENAIKAYRLARNTALQLYPGVLETLELLKDKGCLLIGYTESAEFYTARRVKKLGLDRILDYVWSSPDSELPVGRTRGQVRSQPQEYYQLRRTIHYTLPKGELKPNPKVLADIMKQVGAKPGETVYLGDSLMKDIVMAQTAGITDVWAQYGVPQDRPGYDLLRKVTHWTEADVEREKKLTSTHIVPTHTLSEIREILPLFEFARFVDKSPEQLRLVLEAWKKTVDVQQHFNDLELRIRNYAVTVLGGSLGLAGYAFKENLQVVFHHHPVSIAGLILLFSILPWLSFYFMDRWWYHRLLQGAVDNGTLIESRWGSYLPGISLTQKISKRSPLRLWKVDLHAHNKIDAFYGLITVLLAALALAALLAVHPLPEKPATTGKTAISIPRSVNNSSSSATSAFSPSSAPAPTACLEPDSFLS